LKTEGKTLSPGQDDSPFSYTPMSRAKDMASKAMKRIKLNLKEKK
jgi:hypothetical protein